ncbi:hypothetical protein ACIXUB_15320 [Bacteroides fragilis]
MIKRKLLTGKGGEKNRFTLPLPGKKANLEPFDYQYDRTLLYPPFLIRIQYLRVVSV